MKSEKKLLQIPKGTESYYLEEAYLHRKISESVSKLFFSWGYLPIETPLFDFYDIYKPLLDPSADEKVYRLIDRDGDLLMLRSDITLFMAKQMGLALSKEDLPVRVCYSDAILRYQKQEDISHNEFYQVGAELIGKDGMEGDLEMILLLLSALELLKLSGARLHIGSRSLFNSVFMNYGNKQNRGSDKGYKEEDKKQLQDAILLRNWEKLESLVAESRSMKVSQLFSFIGEINECSKLKGFDVEKDIQSELDYLVDLCKRIDTLGFGEYLRIDLSEVGTQPYYTGIVFEVYIPGVDSAVISGGRYNKLLSRFGFDAPAVGFSILLRKIESNIKDIERFLPPNDIVTLKDGDFVSRFRMAKKLRKEGKIVVL